jgi:hypothetical protein
MRVPDNTGAERSMEIGRDESRRERGAAYVELLLLAFPLCLLSMVITSKLAATSQTRVRAQWQASLSAQRGAVTVCGGSADLSAPWMNQAAADKVKGVHNGVKNSGAIGGGMSVPPELQDAVDAQIKLQHDKVPGGISNMTSLLARISQAGNLVSDLKGGMSALRGAIEANQQDFPLDILTQQQLAATSWSTQTTKLQPSGYYFKPLADQVMPDAAPDVTAQAVFVCNEADLSATGGKQGNQTPMDALRLQLTAWAFDEAQRFY